MNHKTTFNLLLYLFIIFFHFIIPPRAESQSITPLNNSEEQAETAMESGHYSEAIAIWQALTLQELTPLQLGRIYNNIASVYWHLGESGKAVEAWNHSVTIYRKHEETDTEIPFLLTASMIDLAGAYNDLGQPFFSVPLLKDAIEIAENKQLTILKPFAYFALGNAHIIEGNFKKAISAYSISLEYQKLLKNDIDNQISLLLSTYNNQSRAYYQQSLITQQQVISAKELGLETAPQLQQQAQQYRAIALSIAQTAVALAEDNKSLVEAEALLQLALLSPYNPKTLESAQEILFHLPDSPSKVYALLDLAEQLLDDSLPVLMEAVSVARKINNKRVSSFALGALGHHYELQQKYSSANFWTQQALLEANTAIAPDSEYRWHWQMARIYYQTGKTEQAIESYQNAISNLQAIRSDLTQSSRNLAFNFQEEIEPIYRQLLQLLLSQNTNDNADNVTEILKIRDLLQLSELENFFRDDCLSINTNFDTRSFLQETNSVIVTSIILPEQTYLIWQFSDGQIELHGIDIPQNQLKNLVQEWRFNLENQETFDYLPLSQQLYYLFFNQDIKAQLDQQKPSTLVFVNDGILRNVPMSALHDGQEFLIQKYATSNSLGLNLQLNDRRSQKKVLAFGLSEAMNNFGSLPYVEEEMNQIDLVVNSKQFLNELFTADNFYEQTSYTGFSVIHLATHGWFSGSIDTSFLQAYRSQIYLPELEDALIQHNLNFSYNPIQLLILSACDTALGNTRATLGMSGIALRAGVNNVLASLWLLQDRQVVSLISEFYRHWITENDSLAESLQQAQISFINNRNSHPAFWSTIILMTN